MTIELAATMAVVLAAAGFSVFSGWRGAQPPDLARGPRLVPWRPLMMAAGLLTLLALVHLLNLLGVETGRQPR